jgi:aryl-alcohol dehydrogenase-like predicted oxidoreductase
MKYVRLGPSGLKLSPMCLGMMSYGDQTVRAWHLDEDVGRPVVGRAVERELLSSGGLRCSFLVPGVLAMS